MKATRIVVVTGVLVGLVAMTVQAGLFGANVTVKGTTEVSGVIASRSVPSKDLLSGFTTNKLAKVVLDSDSGALEVVDQCGNVITNISTVVGIQDTIGPDTKSNSVEVVFLSFTGTGETNGSAIVSISAGKTFKETQNFEFFVDGVLLQGKITSSSAFKPAHGCE